MKITISPQKYVKDLTLPSLKINMSPKKGNILKGNVIWTNHQFSGDILVFRGGYTHNNHSGQFIIYICIYIIYPYPLVN